MSESVTAASGSSETREGHGVVDRSREAVVEQFDVFVDMVIENALDEFEPFRVVNIDNIPGNSTAKSVLGPVIRDELDVYRNCINDQFGVVMAYAEDGDLEAHRDDFIQNDIFYRSYEGADRRALEEDLTERLDMMGTDMAPLMRSGEDDFWDAAVAAYDEDEAREMLPKHFEYTRRIEDYADGIRLTVEIGNRFVSVDIEYTDEAIRCLRESERQLREHLRRRVDEVYG